MKKLAIFLLVMAVVIGLGSWSTPAQAASVTLNLKATWNPNAETDMSGYLIYRSALNNNTIWYFWNGSGFNGSISGTIDTTTEGTKLPLTPCQLLFTAVVDDTTPTGWIDFALKAADTNNNVSAKATTRYNYNVDSVPPAAPTGFTITKQ